MYAACERNPVIATIDTRPSSTEPSALVSHGPRNGERQNVGRNGPGGAERVGAGSTLAIADPSSAAPKRYERAAGKLARRLDREARTPGDVRRTVHADARPAKPLRDQARRLEPDPHAVRRRAGRVGLGDDRAARREQLAGAAQQRDGRAADADVAVEQQDRPPRAPTGDARPQRAG